MHGVNYAKKLAEFVEDHVSPYNARKLKNLLIPSILCIILFICEMLFVFSIMKK